MIKMVGAQRLRTMNFAVNSSTHSQPIREGDLTYYYRTKPAEEQTEYSAHERGATENKKAP